MSRHQKIKHRDKRKDKAKARATGTPYKKPTRKKGTPGSTLMSIGSKVAGAGAATIITSPKHRRTGLGIGLGALGIGLALKGVAKSLSKKNKPTEKPVTLKPKRKGRITKTRHVTPEGVTKTKTKIFKKKKKKKPVKKPRTSGY